MDAALKTLSEALNAGPKSDPWRALRQVWQLWVHSKADDTRNISELSPTVCRSVIDNLLIRLGARDRRVDFVVVARELLTGLFYGKVSEITNSSLSEYVANRLIRSTSSSAAVGGDDPALKPGSSPGKFDSKRKSNLNQNQFQDELLALIPLYACREERDEKLFHYFGSILLLWFEDTTKSAVRDSLCEMLVPLSLWCSTMDSSLEWSNLNHNLSEYLFKNFVNRPSSSSTSQNSDVFICEPDGSETRDALTVLCVCNSLIPAAQWHSSAWSFLYDWITSLSTAIQVAPELDDPVAGTNPGHQPISTNINNNNSTPRSDSNICPQIVLPRETLHAISRLCLRLNMQCDAVLSEMWKSVSTTSSSAQDPPTMTSGAGSDTFSRSVGSKFDIPLTLACKVELFRLLSNVVALDPLCWDMVQHLFNSADLVRIMYGMFSSVGTTANPGSQSQHPGNRNETPFIVPSSNINSSSNININIHSNISSSSNNNVVNNTMGAPSSLAQNTTTPNQSGMFASGGSSNSVSSSIPPSSSSSSSSTASLNNGPSSFIDGTGSGPLGSSSSATLTSFAAPTIISGTAGSSASTGITTSNSSVSSSASLSSSSLSSVSASTGTMSGFRDLLRRIQLGMNVLSRTRFASPSITCSSSTIGLAHIEIIAALSRVSGVSDETLGPHLTSLLGDGVDISMTDPLFALTLFELFRSNTRIRRFVRKQLSMNPCCAFQAVVIHGPILCEEFLFLLPDLVTTENGADLLCLAVLLPVLELALKRLISWASGSARGRSLPPESDILLIMKLFESKSMRKRDALINGRQTSLQTWCSLYQRLVMDQDGIQAACVSIVPLAVEAILKQMYSFSSVEHCGEDLMELYCDLLSTLDRGLLVDPQVFDMIVEYTPKFLFRSAASFRSCMPVISRILKGPRNGHRSDVISHLVHIVGQCCLVLPLTREEVSDLYEPLQYIAFESISLLRSSGNMIRGLSGPSGGDSMSGEDDPQGLGNVQRRVPPLCTEDVLGLSTRTRLAPNDLQRMFQSFFERWRFPSVSENAGEASQLYCGRAVVDDNVFRATKLLNLLVIAMSKLASRQADLIATATLLLNKIITMKPGVIDESVRQRAMECYNILRYPTIAWTVFTGVDGSARNSNGTADRDISNSDAAASGGGTAEPVSLPFLLQPFAPVRSASSLHDFILPSYSYVHHF